MPDSTDTLHKHARNAFRNYITALGGLDAFVDGHGLNKRTAQRIYKGAAPYSPSLCREVAAAILARPACGDSDALDARALEDYATAQTAARTKDRTNG